MPASVFLEPAWLEKVGAALLTSILPAFADAPVALPASIFLALWLEKVGTALLTSILPALPDAADSVLASIFFAPVMRLEKVGALLASIFPVAASLLRALLKPLAEFALMAGLAPMVPNTEVWRLASEWREDAAGAVALMAPLSPLPNTDTGLLALTWRAALAWVASPAALPLLP